MKKLGFVTPWFGKDIGGGAEMELRGLATHLAQAGNPVEIITTCVKDFTSDWSVNYHRPGNYTECGLPIKRFPVKRRNTNIFDQINYKFMNNFPVTEEEENIYLEEMINSPALYSFLRESKEEYSLFIFIPYMFGTTYFGMQEVLDKAVMIPCLHDESYAYMQKFKNLYPKIAGMIFHAKPEHDLANNLYELNNVKTAVLGEGIYTDISYNKERFIEKYKICNDFILYAGRKDRGKNVDTLIKYFIEYKKNFKSNIKLVLIGGGSVEIPNDSSTEDIIDLGFIPLQDKYDAYAAAKILCQPSKHESFSLVIMESWLCQRPVLVSGACAVTKNFVRESNGGLYFNTYYEFESCINYMFEHTTVADQMGKNGNSYVLNNFSWNTIVENYMTFFRTVSTS